MAKLNLTNPFEMTISDGEEETVLYGTFRDLTKLESKTFNKKNKKIKEQVQEVQLLLKQAKRMTLKIDLKTKLEDYHAVDKVQEKLFVIEDKIELLAEDFSESNAQIELLKERFKLCLGGKDELEITKLSEIHGYDKIYTVIEESIMEYRTGKSEK